jgi:serine/threonine protein kinase
LNVFYVAPFISGEKYSWDSDAFIGPGGKCGTKCLKVKNKKTGKLYACKIIFKECFPPIYDVCLRNEVEYFPDLDHENIVKYKESFEDEHHVFIVMELCEGGELHDLIMRNNAYIGKPPTSELRAAMIMTQLFSAIEYLHRNGFAHCDLKPDNILLSDTSSKAKVKLIDFDHSKWIGQRRVQVSDIPTGSVHFKAPEMFLTVPRYDWACDMWSLGAIMYFILFEGRSVLPIQPNQIASFIENFQGFGSGPGQLSFPSSPTVSAEAKDLITSLMKLKPIERLTASQCWSHKWILKFTSQNHSLDHLEKDWVHPLVMKAMHDCTLLKKTHSMLNIAVSQLVANVCLGSSYCEQIESTFRALDTNGDASVSAKELYEGICKMKDSIKTWDYDMNTDPSEQKQAETAMGNGEMIQHPCYRTKDGDTLLTKWHENIKWIHGINSVNDAQKLIDHMDFNKDGELQLIELRLACVSAIMLVKTGGTLLEAAFHAIDSNHDGKISKPELQFVVNVQKLQPYINVDDIFRHADTNGDNFITAAEFYDALEKL